MCGSISRQSGACRILIAGVDPITAQYYTMEPSIGSNMQRQFEQYPGSFTVYDQQRQLQEERAQGMQDLESSPTLMRTMLGLMLGEAGRSGGAGWGTERTQIAETMFDRAVQEIHAGNPKLQWPGRVRALSGRVERPAGRFPSASDIQGHGT
jgi:hypothetical protein